MHYRIKILGIISTLMILAVISGCLATKTDINVLDDKLNTIRNDQKDIATTVNYLDSLIRVDAEESIRLKAELRMSVKELIEQFQTSQANINDLQDKIDQLLKSPDQRPIFVVPDNSIASNDTTADTTTPVVAQPTMSEADCQNLYDESFINIRSGEYDDAILGFQDFLASCATYGQSDNARFWIGEAYYSKEQFREALSEFDLMLTQFPDSEKRASAMYKVARSHEELGQIKDANDWYQKIVDEFTGSLEARQAQDKLDELKSRQG